MIATCGPAGIQVGEFPCEAAGLALYLLIPTTSDHLFNLDSDSKITLLIPEWEMQGNAQVFYGEIKDLDLLQHPSANWCVLVRVMPRLLHLRQKTGWGNFETLDLTPL